MTTTSKPNKASRKAEIIYTREQLLPAFHAVEDKEHWKNPIDRELSARQVEEIGSDFRKAIGLPPAPTSLQNEAAGLEAIEEAVVFFAGCRPEFERVAAGTKYRIRAIGYFQAIGV